MKIKTSELIGMSLDWAVAVCENLELDENKDPIWFDDRGWLVTYSPSTDWSQGGLIIEHEVSELYEHKQLECWAAKSKAGDLRYGPTPLIAAMRCYLASKLGNEVEVPDELLRKL